MTSWDSYVDDTSLTDDDAQFDHWLSATATRQRFDLPSHRSTIDDLVDDMAYSNNAYPCRIELSVDSRWARFLEWIFSPAVRRNALAATTCGFLGLGIWLLAAEASQTSSPEIDFSAFSPADKSTIQSATADASAPEAEALGEPAAAVDPNAELPASPNLSSDGRVQLVVTRTADGWAAVVDKADGADGSDQVSTVRLLVNGEVLGQSSVLPLDFVFEAGDTTYDVSSLVISTIVDWSEDTEPSSPVSVAVSIDG